MEIDVKELELCKYKVNYSSSSEEIESKKSDILNVFKKAKVPGFRPGKATVQAISYYYKDQINDSLKRALLEDAFHNTLFEKGFKPHGGPRVNNFMLVDGKFTCEFEIYTRPTFEVSNYKNLELPKPHFDESSSDVAEKMLQELRVRFGETVPYQDGDFAQEGDNVIVTYDSFVDGEKIGALCVEGDMITLGKSGFAEFDKNLLGMSLGETREFNLPAPPKVIPSLDGKIITFKVTITMGSKIVPCALDDSFAEKLGKKNFLELKEFVNGKAQAQLSSKNKLVINEAIANKLVDDNKIEIPNWMKLSEAQYLAYNSKLDWQKMPDQDKEEYLNIAARNVTLSLVLDKIRDDEPDAQLTDDEIFNIIKQNIPQNADKSLDQIVKEMNSSGYMQILFARIKDENTLDFVAKNAKFVE